MLWSRVTAPGVMRHRVLLGCQDGLVKKPLDVRSPGHGELEMTGLAISSQGLQQAMAKFQTAAEQISRGPAAPDFIDNAVALRTARGEVEAAVAVLKIQDELSGYLLDVMA